MRGLKQIKPTRSSQESKGVENRGRCTKVRVFFTVYRVHTEC